MTNSDKGHNPTMGGTSGAHPRAGGYEGGRDILRIILSIILPPVGVFLQVGFSKHFWINILLTILGYVPGIVHALWVILTK